MILRGGTTPSESTTKARNSGCETGFMPSMSLLHNALCVHALSRSRRIQERMIRFAQTCEAIAATTKKLEKTALVSDYLRSLPADTAAIAALFLSGRPFAAYRETTLQVGGALLGGTISELAGKSEQDLTESYRRHGDAGAVAAEVLPPKPEPVLSLQDVQASFDQMAVARGPPAKALL